MTPERRAKFKEVVRKRQPNLSVVLENVHDPHNIGAVMRTCDSIGIQEIYVLFTDPRLKRERLDLGKKASSGARKWLDVFFYTCLDQCMEEVLSKYSKIYSTHLDQSSVPLYELDLTQSIALVFGNEHDGVSDDLLAYSSGNFVIPQVGMVESLNISVACAVSLYEAYRQRKTQGFYDQNALLSQTGQHSLLEKFEDIHQNREEKHSVGRMDDK